MREELLAAAAAGAVGGGGGSGSSSSSSSSSGAPVALQLQQKPPRAPPASAGDAGLWQCRRCTLQHAAGYGALTWCGGCLGDLGRAPTARADTALCDLAVLQRNRALASPPAHWPPLLRCDHCTQKFHGPCAWRAGAVECLEDFSGGGGGGGGGLRRKLFLCGPCGSASGGQVGGAPLLLPQRKPDLTIHVHEQGRDVTVLGRLF